MTDTEVLLHKMLTHFAEISPGDTHSYKLYPDEYKLLIEYMADLHDMTMID